MSADWYARRLAEIQGQNPPPPAQVQPPPAAHPAQQPLPGQLPAHLAPYATPPMHPQAAPQTPGAHVGPQAGQIPQQFYSFNENGQQVADDGHVALLYNSAAQTGGSKQVKENSGICPNCNEATYFTIPTGGVMNKDGQTVRAMQCSTCNYPQVQSGSQGGTLATARGDGGPAHRARQLRRDHHVTVAVEGGGYATFEPPGGRG